MTDAARQNEGDRLAMPPEEMFDLLADRAAFGLDDDEAAELDALLGRHGWVRDECFDEVAAMLAVSLDEAESARVAVVEEDRRLAKVAAVHDAADVRAIAHGPQRQHADELFGNGIHRQRTIHTDL